jgi:hypothetical protein
MLVERASFGTADLRLYQVPNKFSDCGEFIGQQGDGIYCRPRFPITIY